MTTPVVCQEVSTADTHVALRFATICLRPDRQFELAIPAETTDPVCLAYANGHYVNQSKVELILKLLGPDTWFLDLGAHVGTFSLAVAAAGHPVVSVEASSVNAACLRASAARNGFSHMHVVHAAVNDRPGTLSFNQDGPWGHVAAEGMDKPTVTVPAIAVDPLLAELGCGAIGCIKMDVEGSEIRAIQGMQRLLSGSNAPPMLFESNGHTLAFFGKTPQELLAELEKLGYRNFFMNNPGRMIQFTSAELQPETVVDFLAVQAMPLDLTEYQIEMSMTEEERVNKVVADCQFFHEHQRTFMARNLAAADPLLLSHPAIIETMMALQKDPVEAVRQAASWWTTRRLRMNPNPPPRRQPLSFNKVCNLEDFEAPDLLEVLRDVYRHQVSVAKPQWPVGVEEGKYWGTAMAVRSLRAFGAIRPDATLLTVGAGSDPSLFYLTNHVKEVFAIGRYLAEDPASQEAPSTMLLDPEGMAPYSADVRRLIVQHMDGRWLRFEPDTFDGIFCVLPTDQYGSLQDVAHACYELGRVLKPGGVLALSSVAVIGGTANRKLGFSHEELEQFIIQASGLESVSFLSTQVSPITWDNRLDQNMLNYVEAHIAWEGLTDRLKQIVAHLYPRIVILRDGAVLVPLHLTLRKAEHYPARPNEWARPTKAVRESIREWNRAWLNRRSTPSSAAA